MSDATTLEQFKAESLNNTMELCYVIDNWVMMLHTNQPLIVGLCSEAKQALIKTLITMRNNIRSRRFPDLTKQDDESYYIDMNDHELVLGKQTFIDPYDPNGIDDNKEYFRIFGRYTFPILSVNDWAKANDVQPNTVRQWINRERINYIKRDNGIGISLLQYNPNAVSQNIPRSAIYKEIGEVPEDIASDFPFLRGKTIDSIHILPQANQTFRVIQFEKTDDNAQPVRPYDIVLTQDEKEKLMRTLESHGHNNKREHNYISPLPEAKWTLPFRLPVISDIEGAKASLRTYPAIGYVGKLEASDFNPVWETGIKIQNVTLLSIKGTILRTCSPEDALLTAIFSAPDDMPNVAIKAVRNDSQWKIDNGWADDTLYVNHLNILPGCNAADATLFLKTLPYRMFNICRHKFSRVLFQLPNIDADTADMLQKAGYRRVPDTQVFYAYVIW